MKTTAIKYQDRHKNEVIFVTSDTHLFTLFLQKKRLSESSVFCSAQDVSPYDITFTFTGKEKDPETGYSYFGARYYDSDLSGLFLSVDPMADKYPSISPYHYCHWNPTNLIDPLGKSDRKYVDYITGEPLGEIDDGVNETVRITSEDYAKLQMMRNYDEKVYDEKYTKYNEMIDKYSIGKLGYDIAQAAKQCVGSCEWAYDVRKDDFKEGTHKCNKFVYDILKKCGVDIRVNGRAPTAGEWAGSGEIDGSTVVNDEPHLGDVIAAGKKYRDATGHVAIITGIDLNTGKITTTSAGKTVVRNENFGSSVLKNFRWGNTEYTSRAIRRIN